MARALTPPQAWEDMPVCADSKHSTSYRARIAGIALLASGLPYAASAAPEIQTWQTASGAEVLFVAAPDLPMLDVRIVFDAGSARDGDKPGLASITAGMLTEGAAGLDADSIAERVEAIGAQLGTGADRDMAYASLRTLTEPRAMETALDTLTKVLAEPSFPAEDFERVRQNRLVGLRLAEQDPKTVGSKALYRAVFGDHPYASDSSGTRESVAALTREDMIGFHRRYFTAANATVAIVGALDRKQAEQLADRVTAGLPEGAAPSDLPPVAELDAGKLERISFPSSQTHVYLGQPGMARGDPDYFTLYVGNHILGGSGLVSQLMHEVREKRGLSYSAYSYFSPMAERGPMIMGLQTQNAKAEEAREVMLDTLRRFVEAGPTDDELEAALKNITGGFPLRIASNSNIVQYLAVIGFYDLPLDYLDRFNERVSAVTKEQIRDAYSRRVHPERLAVVLVGGEAAAEGQQQAQQQGQTVGVPENAGAGAEVESPPLPAAVAAPQAARSGDGEG
jgi:zinc protease